MQTNETITIFKTPFSREYWKASCSELKSVKALAVVALLMALEIVISTIYIPLPVYGTQRIYFSFLVVAFIGMLYGPVVSFWAAFIGDLLGFMIHPQGAFFFGYIITAICGALIFSFFLYRTRITITKIIICKLTINMLVNVCMNSLWDSMILGNGYLPLLIARIPKNLLMLPIEVILLCTVFTMIIPVLKREHLLNYAPFDKKIKWF
ncbi:MAG: folate family ECF transporter S component [Eubacteriales bacterium]